MVLSVVVGAAVVPGDTSSMPCLSWSVHRKVDRNTRNIEIHQQSPVRRTGTGLHGSEVLPADDFGRRATTFCPNHQTLSSAGLEPLCDGSVSHLNPQAVIGSKCCGKFSHHASTDACDTRDGKGPKGGFRCRHGGLRCVRSGIHCVSPVVGRRLPRRHKQYAPLLTVCPQKSGQTSKKH